jgi:pimeloyl-ACP methyl ester carboxylesterase
MGTVESRDGTTIAYETGGEGPPLILVDGALCHREVGGSRPLAERLADHFTVYSYDRRGRGESGDTAPFAVEREVEDLEALIEAAGGSARVYGISSGAALALEAAARGAAISELVLYEPPFIADGGRPPVPADIVAQLEDLLAADRRGDMVRLFMRVVGAPRIVAALMRLLPGWSKLKGVAHTLPYDLAVVVDKAQGTLLPAEEWTCVTMPTTVVIGGKSPAWWQTSTTALTRALPNAEHRVLDGQNHMVKPKALAPLLIELFSSSDSEPVSGEPAYSEAA